MLPALLLGATLVVADTLPTGQVIPEVKVTADPAETYALYLPKSYSPARAWPLILAFDPGGRGRTPVERYQAAAEMYGVIVAGSNNSRNYSRENDRAVVAMATDVLARFHVDERRVYTAGMSGGARVAMGTALASSGIAGVIASSAGFPDGTPRASVPFLVYGTAGTEDFNHLEMRRLDQKLTTPHHLAIFQGGHTWLGFLPDYNPYDLASNGGKSYELLLWQLTLCAAAFAVMLLGPGGLALDGLLFAKASAPPPKPPAPKPQ